MSKLAHSCDETMAQIERNAEDLPGPTWSCDGCGDRGERFNPVTRQIERCTDCQLTARPWCAWCGGTCQCDAG